MKRFLIIALCLGFVQSALAADGDAESGKAKFTICAACHGMNGEGNQAMNAPANGGQDEWYVNRQLMNFRAGTRGAHAEDQYGAQMMPMALSLPDEQAVADVAAYVATLPAPNPPITVEGDAAAGKAAYGICVACHGANGEGNISLNAPRLSNQHDWYIVRQLQNFKTGVRGMHKGDVYGAQMRPMAMVLASDQAVNDVTAYISTLGQ